MFFYTSEKLMRTNGRMHFGLPGAARTIRFGRKKVFDHYLL